MTTSGPAIHLSIGEVLSLVQEDFPDVTISKIRFLESQGLIAPERTGSGFRKFYESDIDRLRWILRQQRDHFLPLKIIKKMLEGHVDPTAAEGVQPTLWSSSDESGESAGSEGRREDVGADPRPGREGVEKLPEGSGSPPRTHNAHRRSSSHPAVASATGRPGVAEGRPSQSQAVGRDDDRHSNKDDERRSAKTESESDTTGAGAGSKPTETSGTDTPGDVEESDSVGGPETIPAVPATEAASAEATHRSHATPADVVAALQEDPRTRIARRGRKSSGANPTARSMDGSQATTGASDRESGKPHSAMKDSGSKMPALMSAEELCQQCGIEASLLESLEQFGLVKAAQLGGRPAYDELAVEIATLAGKYESMGVEPRHLRMYKISAEREAGFIEQLVVPLVKQRNPTARQAATDRCNELTEMGAELHAMVLRATLKGVIEP